MRTPSKCQTCDAVLWPWQFRRRWGGRWVHVECYWAQMATARVLWEVTGAGGSDA